MLVLGSARHDFDRFASRRRSWRVRCATHFRKDSQLLRRDAALRDRQNSHVSHDRAAPSHSQDTRSAAAQGAAAEDCAALYLQAKGLSVIARNLRCRAGELDLVCLDGEVLVIVEVRLRSRADFGGATASVTAHKQRKLIRATRFFWQREPAWRTRMLRFDVVALGSLAPNAAANAAPHIEWIKDAFRTN
jgi:putative endonuclease